MKMEIVAGMNEKQIPAREPAGMTKVWGWIEKSRFFAVLRMTGFEG